MAPKGTTTTQDQFLAVCFMNCVDKPRVDFAKVAAATGMSAGGAANKFRAMMKTFEEEGISTWGGKDSSGGENGVPKTPTARKRTTPSKAAARSVNVNKTQVLHDSDVENGSENGNNNFEEDSEEERPRKKQKTTRKPKGSTTRKTIPKANTKAKEAAKASMTHSSEEELEAKDGGEEIAIKEDDAVNDAKETTIETKDEEQSC